MLATVTLRAPRLLPAALRLWAWDYDSAELVVLD